MHQRAGRATGAEKVDEKIEHLGMKDRRSLEVLTSGGSPGKNENARPDNRADTERGQRPRA